MAGQIELRQVGFCYESGMPEPVFSDISLTLAPGEVFCLLGPNGSGKSTLLKCMVNLLPGFTGRILLDNQSVRSMKPAQIASKIGFVPQTLTSAFPFTVADIVVMGRASKISLMSSPSKKDRQKAAASLARIGISHLSDRPCNRLSGGEWQMVLIARALTRTPGILILDEPTSHLDMGNQVRILEVVDSLARQGITIIMASHFPDHAFLNADQVGILKDGGMQVSGTPGRVLTEDVLAAAYGIRVRVIRVKDTAVDRKICLPVLRKENERSYRREPDESQLQEN